MFDGIRFEGHLEGNHIVLNAPLNFPENARVEGSVEMVGKKGDTRMRKGTQDFSDFFGSIVAPEPITVGNLSREEIYRDDD